MSEDGSMNRMIQSKISNSISSIPPGILFYFMLLSCYMYAILLSSALDGNFVFETLRAVSGFLLLTIFPGWFVLHYITERVSLNEVLYAIGISTSIAMILGWGINSLTNSLHWGPKLTPKAIIPTYVISYTAIAVFTMRKQNSSILPNKCVHVAKNYICRVNLFLLLIPIISIVGSYVINVHSNNNITLISLVTISLIPVFIYQLNNSEQYYVPTILSISFSLLLGNTVINSYNYEGEFSIAYQVIQSGFWTPTGTMGSMPRTAILHPVYTIVMDTSLFWEFKLVQPILFALVPVVVYKISSIYFTADTAFLSAILYIWMPRTHIGLARNLRTSSAIFFAALLFLVLLDRNHTKNFRLIIASVFYISVISSHYGVGPVVLLIIFTAYVTNEFVNYFSIYRDDVRISAKLPILFILLFYFIYNNVIRDVFLFITDAVYRRALQRLFLNDASSTATRSLNYEMPSLSYSIQYYGHILIPILILIGMTLLLLSLISSRTKIFSNDYIENFLIIPSSATSNTLLFSLSNGACVLLALSFGPLPLSAGRLFGLAMILLSPIAIISIPTLRIKDKDISLTLVLMVIFFVFTSGIVSATVTNDISPNPRIDGDRILDSGDKYEKFSYFRRSYSKSSTFASGHTQSHIPEESTIAFTRLSRYHPQYRGDATRDNDYQWTRLNASGSNGYALYTHVDTSTGVATQEWLGFIYYNYTSLPSNTTDSKIYTTEYDKITLNMSST